jgi:lysozyme
MQTLLELIRRFEGLRLKAYYCPAGVLTCGYGSTGPDIKKDTVWTKEQAEDRMIKDAEGYSVAAKKLCPGAVGDSWDALADFAYNLGGTRLAGSTLRRKYNRGDIAGAKKEIVKWVYGGGRKLPGLVLRRHIESTLL